MDGLNRETSDFRTYSAREESESTPAAPRPRAAKTTRDQFTEGTVGAQFKLPRDLITSLKLHSFQSGRTMSEIVLDCLTSDESITKAWVSIKRAA